VRPPDRVACSGSGQVGSRSDARATAARDRRGRWRESSACAASVIMPTRPPWRAVASRRMRSRKGTYSPARRNFCRTRSSAELQSTRVHRPVLRPAREFPPIADCPNRPRTNPCRKGKRAVSADFCGPHRAHGPRGFEQKPDAVVLKLQTVAVVRWVGVRKVAREIMTSNNMR